MKLYPELHIRGDAYGGGYTNGMTHCCSQSSIDMKPVLEDETKTVYEGGHGLTLTQYHIWENDVVTVKNVVENKGTEAVWLDMLSSFAAREIEADTLVRVTSFWSAEGRLLRQNLIDLNMERSWSGNGVRIQKFGSVGSMPIKQYFPFMAMEDSHTGHVTAVQLYCPSTWQLEALCFEDTYRMAGGIGDREFGAWSKKLEPGETFETPVAKLTEADDLYTACDRLVKAQKPRIAPSEKDLPVMFNEWCTTWGNPTAENVKGIADRIAGLGFAYLVIDAGWYRNESPWHLSQGDWIPNSEMFPHGIEEVTKYIRDKGMIPGIWFEVESCGAASEAYSKYPELHMKRDGYPIKAGHRKFWNMTDPGARQYLRERVINFLKDKDFGYMKVDYNETFGPGCDGFESEGEATRLCVKASMDFYDELVDTIPGFVLENCASGGHRLEASTMEHFSMASFSDAHECTCIPLIAANLHRVIRPEQSQIWCVLRAADSRERTIYSLVNTFLGRMCVSGEIHTLNEEQMDLMKAAIAFYHKAAPIIAGGKTIRIETDVKSYLEPVGYQVVERVLGNRKLIVAHRFKNSPEIPAPAGRVLEVFGDLSGDFTACAWIIEE